MSQLLIGASGQYQFSFWYSARPGTGATNDLSFTFDGSAPVTVLNGVSNAGSDHNWLNYSAVINFDGNGLLTINASGISDSYGGSLDMVSFTSLIPITDRNSNNIAFTFGRGHHGTEGKWDGAT